MPNVWMAADSPVGVSYLEAGLAADAMRIAADTPIGTAYLRASAPPVVWMTADTPIGLSRLYAQPAGDEWAAAGFPAPKVDGYGFQPSFGIERTPMVSGVTRQRRRWTDGYRTASVQFVVSRAQLFDLETFLNDKGYDWFAMGIVTEDNTGAGVSVHYVRVKANPVFGNLYGDSVELSLAIEIR